MGIWLKNKDNIITYNEVTGDYSKLTKIKDKLWSYNNLKLHNAEVVFASNDTRIKYTATKQIITTKIGSSSISLKKEYLNTKQACLIILKEIKDKGDWIW